MEGVVNDAGTKVKVVSVRANNVIDFEWADQFVVKFNGWATF